MRASCATCNGATASSARQVMSRAQADRSKRPAHACRGINPTATTHIFTHALSQRAWGTQHSCTHSNGRMPRTSGRRARVCQASTPQRLTCHRSKISQAQLHDACCTRCLSCAVGWRTLINGRRKLTKNAVRARHARARAPPPTCRRARAPAAPHSPRASPPAPARAACAAAGGGFRASGARERTRRWQAEWRGKRRLLLRRWQRSGAGSVACCCVRRMRGVRWAAWRREPRAGA